MRFFGVIIVGGGSAGFLRRFHLRTLVIDSEQSRAASIPLTRTMPSFRTASQANNCSRGCPRKPRFMAPSISMTRRGKNFGRVSEAD
ncbi:hypothetical protein D3Y57_17825 [Sphingomonas paeninsulae]|uniref:Uncharacterized protein n=1 Tax=Sphingomonas paeninsulae TaxID=2319844 RepID=A0A494TNR8_SPHPE|nr:hypothetical protein D3Y57_17825 [Sphingomonas paeninsulae]